MSGAVKKGAARLMAVQAVYEAMIQPRPAPQIIQEYMERAARAEFADAQGNPIKKPDGAHLSAVVKGVAERHADLEAMVAGHVQTSVEMEPLLKAILWCGAYEILALPEIDAPVIINDYLDITHGFYGPGEAGLVNAVLDALRKKLRA